MKRNLAEEIECAVCPWLPDEIWTLILLEFVGSTNALLLNRPSIAFSARAISRRLHVLTDNGIFARIGYLYGDFIRGMNDDMLLLFKGVKSLRLFESRITCAGLQRMTWLKSLILPRDRGDINTEDMHLLTHIKKLSISIPTWNETIRLSDFTHLECLALEENLIMDDDELAHLTRLKSLTLEWDTCILGHCFTALQCLQKMALTCLSTADSFFCGSMLASLSKSLTSLVMFESDVVDDNTLTRLTNIKALSLSNNKHITGDALRQLPQLRSLHLEEDLVIEDRDISGLTQLTHLSSRGGLSNLTGAFLKPLSLTLMTVDIGSHLEHFSDLLSLRQLTSFSYFPSVDYTKKELEIISTLKERGIYSDTYYNIK